MFRLLALIALALASAAPVQAEQSFAIANIGEYGATEGGPLLDLHRAVMPAVQDAWRADDSKTGGGGKTPVPIRPASHHALPIKAEHIRLQSSQQDGVRQSGTRANRARAPPHI